MKKMKKRNCYGCRALRHSGAKSTCLLGYRIRMKRNYPVLPTPAPVNGRCPKPVTHAKLAELLEVRKEV